MVEVFKTNIDSPQDAIAVCEVLQHQFGPLSISLDLEDCDRVLVIKAPAIESERIIQQLNALNFCCEVLLE